MTEAIQNRPTPAWLAEQMPAVKSYASKARASNTKRAYRADWKKFHAWCAGEDVEAFPTAPEVLARYLAHCADSGARVSSIERALVAINQAHRQAGHPAPRQHPLVRSVMQGVRRTLKVAPNQRPPLLLDQLRELLGPLGHRLIDQRDRTLLVIGWMGAFRRSELVSLNVEDVQVKREGLLVHLRSAKADQEGRGTLKALPYVSEPGVCPVRVFEDWLALSGIEAGPIFRPLTRYGAIKDSRLSAYAVARILKRRAVAAGLPEATEFAPHSLRRGFITAAKHGGADDMRLMRHTGHRSWNAYARYVAEVDCWQKNPVASAFR